jgi:hypothetical protein
MKTAFSTSLAGLGSASFTMFGLAMGGSLRQKSLFYLNPEYINLSVNFSLY